MTNYYNNTNHHFCQSPLSDELKEIFDSIPYKDLVKRLKAYRWTGRPGYPIEAMLKAFIASYYLPIKSIAGLVRRLQEDPVLKEACGFDISKPIPHRSTFSRFFSRLTIHQDLVDRCLNIITTELHNLIPSFGENVVVDNTPVRSYSNPDKKIVSDPEAGWIVKEGSEKKEWEWGFRLHLIVDADTELPVAKEVTLWDKDGRQMLLPILRKAKEELPWFSPKAVIADAGYDKYENFEGIVKEFEAEPVIKLAAKSKEPIPEISGTSATPNCPAGLPLIYRSWDKNKGLQYQCPEKARRAICPLAERCSLKMIWVRPVHDYRRFGYKISRNSFKWIELYYKRPAIERCFSRLKETRRLNNHYFRGLKKIALHSTMAVLVMQALALAKAQAGQLTDIRVCARQIF